VERGEFGRILGLLLISGLEGWARFLTPFWGTFQGAFFIPEL